MGIPSLNPLEAPAVVCPTCGGICPAKPVRFGKAKVTEVTYSCVNEATNCGWEVKAALRHITGEGPYALKPDEVKKRREELASAARYQELRDNSVSELIALLPRLKELAFPAAHAQHRVPEPGKLPGGDPIPNSAELGAAQTTGAAKDGGDGNS